MNDEFAAKHAEIRIGFFTVSDVARGKVFGVRLGVESVAGGVHTGEAHAIVNGVEKSLLAFAGHRRILVVAQFGEIAGGEKDQAVEVVKFFGIKNPAVLRTFNVKAMPLA